MFKCDDFVIIFILAKHAEWDCRKYFLSFFSLSLLVGCCCVCTTWICIWIDGWRLKKIRNCHKEWEICYCVTQMDFFFFLLMTLQLTLHIKQHNICADFFIHFFLIFITESLAQEMELERKNRQASENDVKGSLQERSNYYKNSTLYAT